MTDEAIPKMTRLSQSIERGALAERNTSQDEMTAEDYEAIYGWGGQG